MHFTNNKGFVWAYLRAFSALIKEVALAVLTILTVRQEKREYF